MGPTFLSDESGLLKLDKNVVFDLIFCIGLFGGLVCGWYAGNCKWGGNGYTAAPQVAEASSLVRHEPPPLSMPRGNTTTTQLPTLMRQIAQPDRLTLVQFSDQESGLQPASVEAVL